MNLVLDCDLPQLGSHAKNWRDLVNQRHTRYQLYANDEECYVKATLYIREHVAHAQVYRTTAPTPLESHANLAAPLARITWGDETDEQVLAAPPQTTQGNTLLDLASRVAWRRLHVRQAYNPMEEWPSHFAGGKDWIKAQLIGGSFSLPDESMTLDTPEGTRQFTTREYLEYWMLRRREDLAQEKAAHMAELEAKRTKLANISAMQRKCALCFTPTSLSRILDIKDVQPLLDLPIRTLLPASHPATTLELQKTETELQALSHKSGLDLLMERL